MKLIIVLAIALLVPSLGYSQDEPDFDLEIESNFFDGDDLPSDDEMIDDAFVDEPEDIVDTPTPLPEQLPPPMDFPPPQQTEQPRNEIPLPTEQDLDDELPENEVIVDRPKTTVPMPHLQPSQKRRYIRHPYSEKGLTRITSDGDYVYSVKKSPQKSAVSVRFGMYEPTNLTSDNGQTFENIYGGSSIFINGDYEWRLSQKFGYLGLKLGTGISFAEGNGVFENDPTLEAKESYQLFIFPNQLTLAYQFRYSESQWVIPYIEGGGGYFGLLELRDDGDVAFGGAAVGVGAAGGMFNLASLTPDAGRGLDRDYGINNIFLTVEFRGIFSFNQALDVSANIINAGFRVEY